MKSSKKQIYASIKMILVHIGRWISQLVFFRSRYTIFLFFPFYHIGGAEKIHSEIASAIRDPKPVVFFTKKSKDASLRPLFDRRADCVDISFFSEKSWTSYVCFGIISQMINRALNPVVFGSNSNFFYHLLPYLKPETRCVDLIHAFGGGIENVSLPYIEHLNNRIVVSENGREDLIHQYALNNVPGEYVSRIMVIENGITVKGEYTRKDPKGSLMAIFVGRGSEEKRVGLIGKAASKLKESGIPVTFILIGDVMGSVSADDRANCMFKGEITDEKALNDYYKQADILILTSSREGFPLVIMEAMAHGVVPISTDVGGISKHIVNDKTGILIKTRNPGEIVIALVDRITELHFNRDKLLNMSEAAYDYAKITFNSKAFLDSYRKLFKAEDVKVT
ncbi:MAG TPA: glycosyltransferase family 4 protein [Nitrospiria bacterium]|nr:glycosyltransferase family 4 protein [Nitrospiria bacterium]